MSTKTAAILVEPIQGEGGINPASTAYLRALRDIADEFNALLIFDEVQCGMGRTGKLFAYELANVTPDIMGLAIGIGGGFPVGAVLTTEKVTSVWCQEPTDLHMGESLLWCQRRSRRYK